LICLSIYRKVFFIATANNLAPIPAPLRDRMEIIQLAGYSDAEKLNIAKQYLVPRQITENGLTPEGFSIADDALRLIAERYTREAGVRQYERTIGGVIRKVALKIAQGETSHVHVEAADIKGYLGAPRFYPEEARKEVPTGVATGMAWTEMGGEILFIEATLLPGGQGFTSDGSTRRSDAGIRRARRVLSSGRTPKSSASRLKCSKATAYIFMFPPERFRKTVLRQASR
jgi:ATP-dependent Lon protease